MTLLSHGCPTQAIVAAFGVDERTVAAWLTRAGQHCEPVHQHLVRQGRVDLQHVQADELWVKLVGRRVWLAMAMAVPARLWLGGVLSPHRDLVLITTLQPPQGGACRSALEVARAHPSDGSGSDGSSLDHARAHALPSATPSLGGAQTPGPSTQVSAATGYSSGSVTTLKWGGT